MRTIHKYVLDTMTNSISTYEGAKVVHVADQHNQATVWLEVNTLERECMRTLHVVGTGYEIPGGTHVGSLLSAGGHLVFHVYDEGER